MAEGTPTYRIEVLAGGDPLREERWTRWLRDDLAQLDGLSVNYVTDTAATPGSKGGALTDLALVVAALGSSKPLAHVLTTAIVEWCRRERHRTVRITKGNSTLEITGKSDAAQQQLTRQFMERFRDDA